MKRFFSLAISFLLVVVTVVSQDATVDTTKVAVSDSTQANVAAPLQDSVSLLSATHDKGQYPEVLSGPFSLSPSTIVKFSPGNLQYNPAEQKWRFAPKQHIIVGKENSKVSETYDGWIDLFGWGTAKNPTETSRVANYNRQIENTEFTKLEEWGHNIIEDYQRNEWRTPSSDEWEYVLKTRRRANELVAIGTIEGIRGLILLPDNWNAKWNMLNYEFPLMIEITSFDYNHFTLDAWSTYEQKGAIFIPCCGFRDDKAVKRVNNDGCYWSSTASNSISAFSLIFGANNVSPSLDFARYKARGVRLVHTLRKK